MVLDVMEFTCFNAPMLVAQQIACIAKQISANNLGSNLRCDLVHAPDGSGKDWETDVKPQRACCIMIAEPCMLRHEACLRQRGHLVHSLDVPVLGGLESRNLARVVLCGTDKVLDDVEQRLQPDRRMEQRARVVR